VPLAAVLLVGAAAIGASGAPRAPAPGTLIASEPMAAFPGAEAWRVRYHSRDLRGGDVEVTGFVVAPAGAPPSSGRPVVAWAHATTGIADVCAPSRAADPVRSVPWIEDMIAAGYVVAATDYEGLGSPGTHPYLVGPSQGRSVLDSVRAARHLGVGAGTDIVVMGHSQGGHAALFTGEVAPKYAPELTIRGVAPGAPVAAPAAFADYTTSEGGSAGFLLMVAQGYRAAYPALAHGLLTPLGEAAAAQAEQTCAPEVMIALTGVDAAAIVAPGPPATAFTARLERNAPGLRRSPAPVLYWQGAEDVLTLGAEAEAYVRRACRSGTEVDYRVYPGADHVSVLDAARADVFAFTGTVLAGGAWPGTCPGRAPSE
jgi:acetyl esterase/lipase